MPKLQAMLGKRSCEMSELIVCCYVMNISLDLTMLARAGRLHPPHLSAIMTAMVSKDLAVYEPPKQNRSILLYWRLPEEWAEVLYDWVWYNATDL